MYLTVFIYALELFSQRISNLSFSMENQHARHVPGGANRSVWRGRKICARGASNQLLSP